MKQIWFDKKLYVDGLRRLRMVGLVLFAVTVILTLFVIWTLNLAGNVYGYAQLTPVLSVYMYAAPVLLMFTAFSFLFRRSASDLYHAFPITRTGLYVTLSASAFTWIFGTIFITRLLAYLCVLLQGQAFAPGYFALQTLSYCAGAFLIGACALIGVAMTGTRFSAFIVSGLILFLPRCVSALCGYVLIGTAPLLSPIDLGILFDVTLNIPVIWFLEGFLGIGGSLSGVSIAVETVFVSWQAQLYTTVLALLYFALGAFAFLRRDSETAEKSAPSRQLQHVYRSLISMPLFLLLAIVTAQETTRSFGDGYMLLLLFAVLVYFLYELITTKRFKNLLSALYVLPIPVLLCFGIAFGTVSYGNREMRVLPSASELTGIQVVRLRNSGPPYSALLQSELTFAEPELLRLAADGLKYSYESLGDERWGRQDQTLSFRQKRGGTFVRNLRMTSADAIHFSEALAANAAYRSAALALPRDEEIYRISTSTYTEKAYQDRAAIRSLFELYREDRSKLSYEDLAGGAVPQATEAMPAPVSRENMSLMLYQDDVAIEVSLYAEGIHNDRLFSDSYTLSQKTPNAANAAMRFCNNQEQERMQNIQATLNSGVSIDWINIHLRLFNIPTDRGALNSESVGLSGMKDMEEIASMKEKGQNTLVIKEARELLNTLFSGGYAAPDINKPFAQFGVSIEYLNEDGRYTSEGMNTIYAALDEDTMQEVLAMFSVQYFEEEAALQAAAS